ncbi:MAG TPA: RDD family protein [Thermoanaerobaculia bacterium]|nr:RDD family protein [Thermoanaerobaculia bacterium]
MICRNHVDVSEGVRRCARCGGTFCSNCLVGIGGQSYCAGCKTEQLLDARSGVDRSRLNYTTVLKRFGGMLLDNLVLSVPNIIFIVIILVATGAFTDPDKAGLWIQLVNIPAIGLAITYEALMLSLKNGQTLGKMAVGARVVRPDGSRISTGQAWGRAAMRTVLGCLVILDYLPALFTEEKTTLHDMIAGTRVVDVY